MNDVLNNYLLSFLHPWHTQEVLKGKRLFENELKEPLSLELVQEENVETVEENVGVSFDQSLVISWLFVIMNSVYALIGYSIGVEAFKSTTLDTFFMSQFDSWYSVVGIWFLLLKVVVFPLYFWLYGKFWINIIRVFSTLYGRDENADEASEEIVSNAFTTHTFLVIPIFGEFLYRLSSVIYIFGGLKRNLNFTTSQAILVVLCPILLFLFVMMLAALSVSMMFSGF